MEKLSKVAAIKLIKSELMENTFLEGIGLKEAKGVMDEIYGAGYAIYKPDVTDKEIPLVKYNPTFDVALGNIVRISWGNGCNSAITGIVSGINETRTAIRLSYFNVNLGESGMMHTLSVYIDEVVSGYTNLELIRSN